ncbi:MAG: hypothetical protein HXX18_02290 [Bacteroidetes bacterium]|nr:hypothetical protein [Bacteroidota bacterium]
MKTKIIIIYIFLFGILFTACSNHLVGTWNIKKYSTTKTGQASVLLNDIGTITFYKDGNGEKNLNYILSGEIKRDSLPFKWAITDKYIRIDSKGSVFAKTWVLMNTGKKFQKWETTDGSDLLEVLELKK